MKQVGVNTLIKWTEPRQVARHRNWEWKHGISLSNRIGLFIGGLLIPFIYWTRDYFVPTREPLPIQTVGLLSILFGFIVAYVIPMLLWIFPGRIELTTKGVKNNSILGKFYKFTNVSAYAIDQINIGSERLAVLTLELKNDPPVYFGIAPEVSVEEVGEILTRAIEEHNTLKNLRA